MSKFSRLASTVAFISLFTGPAMADSLGAADAKQMHDYSLSMAKLAAYDTATSNLKAATQKDPGLKTDYEAASSEHTKTLSDEFAKMTHHPRVFAFFSKQGLSKEDVILIPMTLMSACMAAQYPSAAKGLADQTSQSQIDFCKQNGAAVKKMKFMNG